MALRGHASIQGSTDIPTLYNILPGYIPMPHTERYGDLDTYIGANTSPTGWWGHFRAYYVSLMKAYFGENATTATISSSSRYRGSTTTTPPTGRSSRC